MMTSGTATSLLPAATVPELQVMTACDSLCRSWDGMLTFIADSTEDLDYNSTLLFSGGIDPTHLPKIIVDGKCTLQYPHDRLQVNTVFEIIKASGKQTAYVDKHPAYDIVRGPSGTGLSTGYFPEIASIPGVSPIPYDTWQATAESI